MTRLICLVCAGVFLGTGLSAHAQPGVERRAQRAPSIDLADQADQRREGQVLPGDPDPAYEEPRPPQRLNEQAGAGTPDDNIEPEAGTLVERPADQEQIGSVDARVAEVRGREGSVAQWRRVGADWSAVRPGDGLSGVLEIRTGLGGRVVVEIQGFARVEVRRLSAVRLERRIGVDGSERLGVLISFGTVAVTPTDMNEQGLSERGVHVSGPGRKLELFVPAIIDADAFWGTTDSALETREPSKRAEAPVDLGPVSP